MLKWTPRPGSSASRAWRGDRARDRLEPLQHGRVELRGRGLGSVFVAICRGFAQVAPPFPSSSTPWYVKIDHLYFIAAEWRVVYHRVYKSLPWQSQGSNCRRWIYLDEFAFSLGHLKDRTCSISVSSSWNWNGNGKQCLKLCIELRWGAKSSRCHQAVIAPHAKTQQCFLSPHYWDWMTEVKRAQDFSKQHPEAQMNGRNTCELLNQLRWDLFSRHFKSSSTNSKHMLSQPF